MQSRETFCSGTDLGFGCKLWEAATGRGEAGASQCQSGKCCDFLHLKKVSFLSFKSKQQFCSIHIRMYIVMSELCHRMKAKWDELTSKLHRHRWENLSKIAQVLSFDHVWPSLTLTRQILVRRQNEFKVWLFGLFGLFGFALAFGQPFFYRCRWCWVAWKMSCFRSSRPPILQRSWTICPSSRQKPWQNDAKNDDITVMGLFLRFVGSRIRV